MLGIKNNLDFLKQNLQIFGFDKLIPSNYNYNKRWNSAVVFSCVFSEQRKLPKPWTCQIKQSKQPALPGTHANTITTGEHVLTHPSCGPKYIFHRRMNGRWLEMSSCSCFSNLPAFFGGGGNFQWKMAAMLGVTPRVAMVTLTDSYGRKVMLCIDIDYESTSCKLS